MVMAHYFFKIGIMQYSCSRSWYMLNINFYSTEAWKRSTEKEINNTKECQICSIQTNVFSNQLWTPFQSKVR